MEVVPALRKCLGTDRSPAVSMCALAVLEAASKVVGPGQLTAEPVLPGHTLSHSDRCEK